MTRRLQEIENQLRRPARAGLYSIPSADVDACARIARALQLREICVDLTGCTDKAGLLQCVSRAYAFPEWFGHNWDALADALGDLSWLPSEGYLTLVSGIASLPPGIDEDTATLLEILGETADDWTADGIPFWILVEEGAPGIKPLSAPD
ncbi:MAG: barstar family protein [Rhodocyclaceae bacterium]|nr:barstar family protein [Rhodocyclaceae bacterium]MCP5311618.1 barstar family protein [Zoogloeaceae bacterium]